MNERIEELMVQAGITTNLETDLFDDEGNIGKWLDHFAEEFAELIVRECVEWCDAYATIDGTAQQIRDAIKNQFGVE